MVGSRVCKVSTHVGMKWVWRLEKEKVATCMGIVKFGYGERNGLGDRSGGCIVMAEVVTGGIKEEHRWLGDEDEREKW